MKSIIQFCGISYGKTPVYLPLIIGMLAFMFSLAFTTDSFAKVAGCMPITKEYISLSPEDSAHWTGVEFNEITVSIPEDIKGFIRLNQDLIDRDHLQVVLSRTDTIETGRHNTETDDMTKSDDDVTSYVLLPEIDDSGKKCTFNVYGLLSPGKWSLSIPEKYFLVIPECQEVDDIDLDIDSICALEYAGAWHSPKTETCKRGLFTIHDDDGIDGMIGSSKPSDYMKWGYFSILYPVLESLGIRGCVSMEGRRCGFTSAPPVLNENGQIARRLQDERDWEIQSHSMVCSGERLNCWMVDGLDSDLALHILTEGPNKGNSIQTVSVYDTQTGRQYMPDADNSEWVESKQRMVKPYVGDYNTKKAVMYDDSFDVSYHWGEWFRLAEQFGINGRSWVTYNSSSCHALVPKILSICPNGFADTDRIAINNPPFLSTAVRCLLEGQTIKGYKGEMDPDCSYNKKHYEYYKDVVDKAVDDGGWIVFGLHAYRKCWQNHVPGALVSEGGTYPDEWVNPLEGIDPLHDPLTPPARLGISNWSEWYPCPGTRLRMMWDIFRYAIDRGLINVTSAEGFEILGNRKTVGYFNQGYKIGQNVNNISGTEDKYPHYIESSEGEKFYYNPLISEEMSKDFMIVDYKDGELPDAYSTDGLILKIRTLKDLPQGIWIVNGVKHLVR